MPVYTAQLPEFLASVQNANARRTVQRQQAPPPGLLAVHDHEVLRQYINTYLNNLEQSKLKQKSNKPANITKKLKMKRTEMAGNRLNICFIERNLTQTSPAKSKPLIGIRRSQLNKATPGKQTRDMPEIKNEGTTQQANGHIVEENQ